MSSTPETGRLACTSSVVSHFWAARACTDGGTSAVYHFKAAQGRIPLIYRAVSTLYVINAQGRTSSVHKCSISLRTDGYTSAVSRSNAARGRIPLIYARSIDAVCHRRPRQDV